MITPFQDRFDAGRQLGARLSSYAKRGDVVVLALPRGGVPVGYEVARQLNAPLDIFLVRKLGVPGYEELAMGAIASGGARVVNEEVVEQLQIPEDVIDAATIEQQQELERREAAYRAGRPLPELKNKTVILVDDGLATGSSMCAAVQALRLLGPKAIVVAVPVGAAETCEMLQSDADDVVCLMAPGNFSAVGRWYLDFTQTSDEEVSDLLDRAAHERQVDRNAENERKLPASLE